jgi:predicted amidohydrolase
MRAGLVQLTVGDDPAKNLPQTLELVRAAVDGGAGFVLTPECTNALSSNRDHQRRVLRHEDQDQTLAALRDEAVKSGIWLLIGSLGLLTHDADGRFANRSLLIAPSGAIAARYDKIHMFDVNVSETEVYRHLAQSGAQVLTVPAAFNHVTGAAHWETLLRARAIETGCFVLAPAQCGFHPEAGGKGRRTHGHSLAIAPWGEVLADGGTEPGVSFADLDLAQVTAARARVPSLTHDRTFTGP